jgi:hypothetical protein
MLVDCLTGDESARQTGLQVLNFMVVSKENQLPIAQCDGLVITLVKLLEIQDESLRSMAKSVLSTLSQNPACRAF